MIKRLIRDRIELEEQLLPYILQIPLRRYRPWHKPTKSLDAYQNLVLLHSMDALEKPGNIYNETDIQNVIQNLVTSEIWYEPMFRFLMEKGGAQHLNKICYTVSRPRFHFERSSYCVTLLVASMTQLNYSLLKYILLCGPDYGMDMYDSRNGIDVVEFLIQQSHPSYMITELLEYIPTIKFADQGWTTRILNRLILSIRQHDFLTRSRSVELVSTLLDYVDITGNGIEIGEDLSPESCINAPSVYMKRERQVRYRQEQMKESGTYLVRSLGYDLCRIVCSFIQLQQNNK